MEARLRGIQSSPCYNTAREFQKLEAKLIADLKKVLL